MPKIQFALMDKTQFLLPGYDMEGTVLEILKQLERSTQPELLKIFPHAVEETLVAGAWIWFEIG